MATEPSSTVLKAFRVLDLFRTHRQLGAAQCAELLGMTRANTHRLLTSLAAAGAVDRTEDGQYRLSIWALEIGAQAPMFRLLHDQAEGPLESLADQTGLQAHLAVRDGTELVHVLKIGEAGGRVQTRPGGRNPLYATGLGKALLAHASPAVIEEVLSGPLDAYTRYTKTSGALLLEELSKVRSSGFAFDHEERQTGISCIAMPLRGRDGQTLAAISIPTDTERHGRRIESLRAPLRETAVELERRLRAFPTTTSVA